MSKLARAARSAGAAPSTAPVFQANVRGELIPYEIAAPRFYYRNAGTARHRGVELSGAARLAPGVSVDVAWTYSDYRYRDYTFTTDTGAVTHVLDGRSIPGIPTHWLQLITHISPAGLSGAWAEVQQTYSSGFFVSDTMSVRASPWWATGVRLGWDGKLGGGRFSPFIGVNNAFNHLYVSSVVINAARDRYYEPAPRRNFYVGLSVGAGRKAHVE